MLLLWRSGVPKIIRFGPMAVNANRKQVTNTGDEVMVTINGDENPMGRSMSPSSRHPYLVTFISSQFWLQGTISSNRSRLPQPPAAYP
jgi:hypothetical protein